MAIEGGNSEYRKSGGTRRTGIRSYRGGPIIGYTNEISWTYEWQTDKEGYFGSYIDPDSLASLFNCDDANCTPDSEAPTGVYRETWSRKLATTWL